MPVGFCLHKVAKDPELPARLETKSAQIMMQSLHLKKKKKKTSFVRSIENKHVIQFGNFDVRRATDWRNQQFATLQNVQQAVCLSLVHYSFTAGM